MTAVHDIPDLGQVQIFAIGFEELLKVIVEVLD